MGFIQEFRDFAVKGNVFDMAIGVIMGGAFGKIVGSLIENCISPILGLAGKVSFTEMYFMLQTTEKYVEGMPYGEAKSAGAAFGYGAFVTDIINFLIMALVVFLLVKMFNSAKKRMEKEKPAPAPSAPPAPSAEQKLLTEIRDLLAKR
jgi:large conductance mechanosensitive channel